MGSLFCCTPHIAPIWSTCLSGLQPLDCFGVGLRACSQQTYLPTARTYSTYITLRENLEILARSKEKFNVSRVSTMKRIYAAAGIAVIVGALVVVLTAPSFPFARTRAVASTDPTGGKIKHIVIIVQENRSFDEYFGTYVSPTAGQTVDGIPPGIEVPNGSGGFVAPFHNHKDVNKGGPHTWNAQIADVDGGKMDGFVISAGQDDVMGYHDCREIPNYWTYANNFELQDHMYESVASWSLPSHLFMVSNWSASCTNAKDPASCTNDPQQNTHSSTAPYAWTDITYLLHKSTTLNPTGVSWGYYIDPGGQPDTDDGSMGVSDKILAVTTPSIWNPLPQFTTVKKDQQLPNVQTVANYITSTENGSLPSVSWIVPNQTVSEHPPANIADGQAYTTKMINAIMTGREKDAAGNLLPKGSLWKDTAILLVWDDFGGFYDHEVPVNIDENGYGIRVPGILISPYAMAGTVDHEDLSLDSYNRLIEDVFLGGQRLDPNPASAGYDGRADPRPDIREDLTGNLLNEFNFSQTPLPPLVLPEYPPACTNPPPPPTSE